MRTRLWGITRMTMQSAGSAGWWASGISIRGGGTMQGGFWANAWTRNIPIVWLFRSRWQLLPERLSVNMGALVLCSLLVACAATVVTLGQILITPFPPGYVLRYGQLIAQLALGNFLGILTITPVTLVFHQFFLEADGNWRQMVHGI